MGKPAISKFRQMVGNIVLVLFFIAGIGSCIALSIDSCKDNNYPTSYISYEKLNLEIGCGCKYSATKRKNIFNSHYKNHWMDWTGEVVLSDTDCASLNIDGKGTQDLAVNFANKNAGYHLMEGDFISVRFLMKSVGGCILPFVGEKATILKY